MCSVLLSRVQAVCAVFRASFSSPYLWRSRPRDLRNDRLWERECVSLGAGALFLKNKGECCSADTFWPFSLTCSVPKNVFTKTVAPGGGGSTPTGGRRGKLPWKALAPRAGGSTPIGGHTGRLHLKGVAFQTSQYARVEAYPRVKKFRTDHSYVCRSSRNDVYWPHAKLLKKEMQYSWKIGYGKAVLSFSGEYERGRLFFVSS